MKTSKGNITNDGTTLCLGSVSMPHWHLLKTLYVPNLTCSKTKDNQGTGWFVRPLTVWRTDTKWQVLLLQGRSWEASDNRKAYKAKE